MATGTLVAGRYRVEACLGQGGLARTYSALDRLYGQRVALKLLSAEQALAPVLLAEFELLSGRVHPHLCRVLDFGYLPSGANRARPYYTAALIEGGPLDEFAVGAPPSAVRRALCDALTALAWLHSQGIRHGDFKPGNILVDSQGRGVLIDLSCAERFGVRPAAFSGTPGFVAPELPQGDPVDGRADIYAIGATLAALGESFTRDADRRLGQRCRADEPSLRPSDVEEVLEALGGTPAARRRLLPSGPLLARGGLLGQFDLCLRALCDHAEGPRVLWVQGPSGSGKSRALRTLKWRAQICCETVEGCAGQQGGVGEWLGRAAGTALAAGVVGVLDAYERLADRESPLVLVFDALDCLTSQDQGLFEALLRLVRGREPFVILCGSREKPPQASAQVLAYALEPLTPHDVEQWAGALLSAGQARELCEWAGGLPAVIEQALSSVYAGGRFSDTLSQLRAPSANLSGLSPKACRALAALAIRSESIGLKHRTAVGIAEEETGELVDRGLVRLEGDEVRLGAAASRSAILEALGVELVESMRDQYAEWLEHQTTPRAMVARIDLELDRGDVKKAEGQFLLNAPVILANAWAFRQVARRLPVVACSAEVTSLAVRVLLEAGDPRAALELASKLPEAASSPSESSLLIAECELRLGHIDRSMAQLSTIDAVAHAARAAHLQARLHIARGEYPQARSVALRGLSAARSTEEQARLLEVAGLSDGYLGEVQVARERLQAAAEHYERLGDVRGRLRVGLSMAIVAFRSGELHEAIERNQEAVALAERHAIDDQLATALVNLGTSLQKAGDWGGAVAAYERALRLAIALGKGNSEASLGYNLANLYADIGLFERASATLERAHRIAIANGLGHILAPHLRLRAECQCWGGEYPEALETLEQARDLFLNGGAARDVCDCDLWTAEIARMAHDTTAVGTAMARAEASGMLSDSAHKTRYLVVSARLAMDDGRAAAAISHLQQAESLAGPLNRPDLMADVDLALADAYDSSGHHELAMEHRSRARRAWQRIGASLPESFREVFGRHPRRQRALEIAPPPAGLGRGRAVASPSPSSTGAGQGGAAASPSPSAAGTAHRGVLPIERLERFFAVNRTVNSSLAIDRVLENAMDAAIELTAAERGFVLLSEGGSVTVAAARNLDGERIGRSHLKFSRSIAERVMANEEPLVTVDAQSDERLREQRSVHALRLKSVACVPIRSQSGIVGALYLDNRFERGRFGADDVQLLLAFADQVAIALENARLHVELTRRTKELEEAHAAIRQQMEGQAQQIEILTKEVEARQTELEYRFDYRQIAGHSAPMRAIFAKLDRIIDSDLPVLVQGESGTGKELCARAIHFNSPRKKSRLVSLNCAALPEALLESELFGYRRGAFTGAERDHRGLLAQAAGGTVFLDEVGEMSMAMQAKLLRVLEQKEVRPLGDERVVPIDARFVCATNRMLLEEVRSGRFRQDLYYRLGVIEITIPPLRERLDDLPFIVDRLLSTQHPGMRISAAALKRLTTHTWPGNVRELANVLARAALMAEDGHIQAKDLTITERTSTVSLPDTRREFSRDEASRIRAALVATRWNVSLVSRQLGIPRQTLYRKLERYRIWRSS